MFLTLPTIEELQKLELPLLMDMLAKQTSEYVKYVKTEAISSYIKGLKDNIDNIQTAIESKKYLEKPGSMQIQLPSG